MRTLAHTHPTSFLLSPSPLTNTCTHTKTIETYLGMPADIERALNNITVQLSFLAIKGPAQLNITLYDGDGEGCIGNKYLGEGSLRTECFIRFISIPVTVLKDLFLTKAESVSGAASSPSFLTFKEYVIGSAVCAVILLACARCWYVRSRRRKLERYGTTTTRNTTHCCLLSFFQ